MAEEHRNHFSRRDQSRAQARFTIGKKLALISIALSAVLVGLSAFMLFGLKDTMIEGRKVKLRALVESAVNVVNHYSLMEADGTLMSDHARKAAVTAIAGMIFDGARETQSITRAIGDITASVRATEATAKAVSRTSTVMQEKAETVSREVQDFLQRIRARVPRLEARRTTFAASQAVIPAKRQ